MLQAPSIWILVHLRCDACPDRFIFMDACCRSNIYDLIIGIDVSPQSIFPWSKFQRYRRQVTFFLLKCIDYFDFISKINLFCYYFAILVLKAVLVFISSAQLCRCSWNCFGAQQPNRLGRHKCGFLNKKLFN